MFSICFSTIEVRIDSKDSPAPAIVKLTRESCPSFDAASINVSKSFDGPSVPKYITRKVSLRVLGGTRKNSDATQLSTTLTSTDFGTIFRSVPRSDSEIVVTMSEKLYDT